MENDTDTAVQAIGINGVNIVGEPALFVFISLRDISSTWDMFNLSFFIFLFFRFLFDQ